MIYCLKLELGQIQSRMKGSLQNNSIDILPGLLNCENLVHLSRQTVARPRTWFSGSTLSWCIFESHSEEVASFGKMNMDRNFFLFCWKYSGIKQALFINEKGNMFQSSIQNFRGPYWAFTVYEVLRNMHCLHYFISPSQQSYGCRYHSYSCLTDKESESLKDRTKVICLVQDLNHLVILSPKY